MALLGPRLAAVAARVPQGAKLGDIGTDHAYLPVALCEERRTQLAVAVDVHRGPYESALANVRNRGLSEKISVRLGDGLTPLGPGEVDTLVLAGIGGGTMLDILTGRPEVLAEVSALIVQPQGGESRVRRSLLTTGWLLRDEVLVEEEGKIYVVMAFAKEWARQPIEQDAEKRNPGEQGAERRNPGERNPGEQDPQRQNPERRNPNADERGADGRKPGEQNLGERDLEKQDADERGAHGRNPERRNPGEQDPQRRNPNSERRHPNVVSFRDLNEIAEEWVGRLRETRAEAQRNTTAAGFGGFAGETDDIFDNTVRKLVWQLGPLILAKPTPLLSVLLEEKIRESERRLEEMKKAKSPGASERMTITLMEKLALEGMVLVLRD